MKRVNVILAIILLLTGCSGIRKSDKESNAFITVDVSKNYPKKELILQDFMDVEYIPLETSGEFLTQGHVLDIGKDILIVKNSVNNGDIFIFDRKGKGLRKFNRLGSGPEEYTFILGVVLDEVNNEIFVNDHSIRKILVYDFYGKFIRSFNHKEEAEYDNMYNFDRDKLICRDASYRAITEDIQSFVIISKQDGSIIKEIQIPFEKKKSTIVMQTIEQGVIASGIRHSPIIPYNESWILLETSSDTIYTYSSDYKLTPFMTRIPSVQSMNPEMFLFPEMLTDSYYFMKTVKKEYDFTTGKGFPNTHLLYDRQEKKIYECTVYSGDFTTKRVVEVMQRPIDKEIAFWHKLEAYDLFEAHEKGELKGKLKEIAAELEEDSNPVIMLVKNKR